MTMKNKVLGTIEKFGMISRGETVVVGVSGGADSVSLLHLLLEMRGVLNISVAAVHLNHMLRGEQANKDELFVRELCEAWGVPCMFDRADCAALAKEAKEGLEECGRRLRYELFDRAAREYKADKTATAHTANDNFETLLLNITRGSSLRGVCGIPPVRGHIIRPLIECSRGEIESYCLENGIRYMTDSTNLSDDYSRNKIRNNVVPVLLSINSGAVFAASKLCRLAARDDEFLNKMSGALLEKARLRDNEFNAGILREAEKPVRSRLIAAVIENISGKRPEKEDTVNAVEEILQNGGKAQLQKNLFTELKGNRLIFYNEKKPERLEEIPIDSFEFYVDTGLFRVRGTRCENSEIINGLLIKECVDCDSIHGGLVLRGRKQGDKITLGKRNVTKTLKKLFSEEQIDEELRDLIPVLADKSAVVWVMGFGVNAKNAANEKSVNVMKVEGENICEATLIKF